LQADPLSRAVVKTRVEAAAASWGSARADLELRDHRSN